MTTFHREKFNDDMTLGEARALLRTLIRDGHKCPCCTQLAKIYRRKLNSAQAVGLIRFYRLAGTRFEHLPTLGLSQLGGEFARLRFWGLVAELADPRPDGGRAGYWRVTGDGEMWVNGLTTVQSHALIYDNRCLGLDGQEISIHEALGRRFDYAELMAS